MLLCRLKQIAVFKQPRVPSRHCFPFSHLPLLKRGICLRLQQVKDTLFKNKQIQLHTATSKKFLAYSNYAV